MYTRAATAKRTAERGHESVEGGMDGGPPWSLPPEAARPAGTLPGTPPPCILRFLRHLRSHHRTARRTRACPCVTHAPRQRNSPPWGLSHETHLRSAAFGPRCERTETCTRSESGALPEDKLGGLQA